MWGDLIIDYARRLVTVASLPVKLTATGARGGTVSEAFPTMWRRPPY